MTHAQHTPGPWLVRKSIRGGIDIFGDDGAQILLSDARLINQEANARLIAEAPAMLEVLRAAVACLRGFSGSEDFGPIDDEAVDEGLAILARIEGGDA